MNTCFVIMPFLPELNYFYLYIRKHLKDNHQIECERGDHKILTVSLIEKIRKSIREADVIMADISSKNPNVFYELGLADAYRKKVILIVNDKESDIPTDIKHLEFIKYNLSKDIDFLDKLDNALNQIFNERYIELYEKAKGILKQFNTDVNLNIEFCTLEEFKKSVSNEESTQGIPEQPILLKRFLLPKIIKKFDMNIIEKIDNWINK